MVAEVTEAEARAQNNGWLDANPFYLLIVHGDGRIIEQDLAERGWIKKLEEANLLWKPGDWYLVRKAGGIIALTMVVHDGERPYYVARHVGWTSPTGSDETVVYGIGKARLDGHTDRLWVMANGAVTLGDDVGEIALRILKQGIMPSW